MATLHHSCDAGVKGVYWMTLNLCLYSQSTRLSSRWRLPLGGGNHCQIISNHIGGLVVSGRNQLVIYDMSSKNYIVLLMQATVDAPYSTCAIKQQESCTEGAIFHFLPTSGNSTLSNVIVGDWYWGRHVEGGSSDKRGHSNWIHSIWYKAASIQPPATVSTKGSSDTALDILPQVLFTLAPGFTGACTLR